MCAILLPIKPKYSQAILSGKKTFELRRTIPKRKVDKIYIYETYPTMKVVGEAIVKTTHKNQTKELWKLTKGKNSVSFKEFCSYFLGKKEAYAYEIQEYKKYDQSLELKKLGFGFIPQGFAYADHLIKKA